MQVFKTYFKIVNSNIAAVFIYVGVFITIAVIMSGNVKNTDESQFVETSIDIGFVDRDKSPTSEAIKKYLSEIHSVITLPDDKDVMQDNLYYRNVEYILIIPTNFEDSFLQGGTTLIDCIKVPNSESSIYVDLQIEQFLKTLRTFLRADYDITTAMSTTKEVLAAKTSVTLALDTSTITAPSHYYYYKFVPYILIAIMIQTISNTLLVFNKTDIRRRSICSSLSLKSRNFQLTAGSILLSIVIFITITIAGVALNAKAISDSGTYLYYVLNSLAFMTVCISIGYLVGNLSHNLEMVSAMGTILSLALSFLGGVFVPLEVMSKSVVSFSKFLPTYWYTVVNDTIMSLNKVSDSIKSEIFLALFIQLCFAFAIFCIALVVSKKKLQQA